MPVAEHPIHPSTQREAGYLYGCHNRPPFRAGYMAPDGYALGSLRDNREVQLTYVPHVMTTDCHHGKTNDKHCGECKWKS